MDLKRRAPRLVRALGMGFGVLGAAWLLSACESLPVIELTVTTTADGNDADPGDGVCEMTDGAGDCSLRAAVDEANDTADHDVTVHVPAGTYLLGTSAGEENANTDGDLDIEIATSLRIVAQGAGAVIDAGGGMGGFEVHDGQLTVRNLAVTGANGRGLLAHTDTVVAIDRSTVHGNAGIGIVTEAGGTARMFNTTVTGNGGSGVFTNGALVAGYSTVTDNGSGGVLGPGAVTLATTIVAENGALDCAQPVTSLDHNIDTDGTCGLDQPGDQPDVPTAALAPLSADPVPYHPLLPGSPAVDARPPGPPTCPAGVGLTDQRGVPRPQGGGCDVGAVEMDAGALDLVVNDPGDTHDDDPGDGICADSAGSCTLRAAIDETNAYVGPDTIALAPGVDPTLSIAGTGEDLNASGDLDISDGLTLIGNGNVIDADGKDRALHAGPADLHVEGVTITGGASPPPPTSLVEAGGGGLLYMGAGELVVVDAVIVGNWAHAGGGVYADGGGTYLFERSAIIENGAGGGGGVNDGYGGGLYLADGVSTVSNSTVSGNQAIRPGAGIFSGVRLFASIVGTVDIRHSTVVDNTGGAELGRFSFSGFEGGNYVLRASIIGPTGSSSACASTSGVLSDFVATSTGYTIVTDFSCNIGHATDLEGLATFPSLGGLADNGGDTFTHLPAAGSSAVDAVPAAQCPTGAAAVDQRGVARPQGTACDVGAVEQ